MRAKRKKHFPLSIQINIPKREEPITIEVQSNTKVKTLKIMIEDHLKKEIPAEKMQLQVEGGEVLSKNAANLDDYNLTKDCIMNLEILDKGIPLQVRERKPKEVQKQFLSFKIRGEDIVQKVEVQKTMRVK